MPRLRIMSSTWRDGTLWRIVEDLLGEDPRGSSRILVGAFFTPPCAWAWLPIIGDYESLKAYEWMKTVWILYWIQQIQYIKLITNIFLNTIFFCKDKDTDKAFWRIHCNRCSPSGNTVHWPKPEVTCGQYSSAQRSSANIKSTEYSPTRS